MKKKISLLILSLALIIGAGVFYYVTQFKKGVTPKKELAQKATAINYKGAMVINKVKNINEVMAELNNEATAAGGTFDLKTMAKSITAEALKAFSDSKEKSLPLVASWNTGIPTYIKAMDPMYMISRIENGEHILVSWKLDPYYDESIGYDYYEKSIKKAAELGLPLVFVVPAPESALSSDTTFLSMDAKDNSNVVNAQGEILNKLSPFGPDKNWKDVGEMWASSDLMTQIQEWYPNPPLVVFVSENASDKLTWKEIDTSARYRLKNRDDNFKRTLINAQWIEKYRQLHEGFKTAFTKQAWKDNVKFITRDKLSTDLGATKNWIDDATVTNLYANIWPLTADGVNVDFALKGTDTATDGPHVLVNNLPFMLNEAKTISPRSASQLSINADSIVDNPARYRGLTQFALWFLRPSFVRQDSEQTQRAELEKTFQEVSDSVELIHYNPELADFWRNGTLVKNGTSNLDANIPTQYKNDPRWFLLDTDANPKRPWTSDTAINVWAFALVIGEAPNREWLVYVQSPDGNKSDVTVSVPGYKDVLVDASSMGSFYSLSENKSKQTLLNSITVQPASNTVGASKEPVPFAIPKDYVNVVDYGAVGDGVTDNRKAFQDALDTGRSVYVPKGNFLLGPPSNRHDFSIRLRNNPAFFGEGTLINGGTGTTIIATGVQNLIINGLTFINASLQSYGAQYVRIQNNTFIEDNNPKYFQNPYGGISLVGKFKDSIHDVNISNNTFIDISRGSIGVINRGDNANGTKRWSLDNVYNINVDHNTILYDSSKQFIGGWTIGISFGGGVMNSNIHHNFIQGGWWGIENARSTNTKVYNNNVEAKDSDYCSNSASQHEEVYNNNFSGSLCSVRIMDAENAVIKNNICNGEIMFIDHNNTPFTYNPSVLFRNNYVKYDGRQTVQIFSSRNLTIERNYFENLKGNKIIRMQLSNNLNLKLISNRYYLPYGQLFMDNYSTNKFLEEGTIRLNAAENR